MKRNKVKITENILQRSWGNRFYYRVINQCQSKLANASLSTLRKIILIFLIILCSKIDISFSAPISRSIRFNPEYVLALYPPERNTVYITWAKSINKLPSYTLSKTNLRQVGHHNFYIFLDIAKTVLLDNTRAVSGFLFNDDRVLPYILLKISPIMSCGPPCRGLSKESLQFNPSFQCPARHNTFNQKITYPIKADYLEKNKKLIHKLSQKKSIEKGG